MSSEHNAAAPAATTHSYNVLSTFKMQDKLVVLVARVISAACLFLDILLNDCLGPASERIHNSKLGKSFCDSLMPVVETTCGCFASIGQQFTNFVQAVDREVSNSKVFSRRYAETAIPTIDTGSINGKLKLLSLHCRVANLIAGDITAGVLKGLLGLGVQSGYFVGRVLQPLLFVLAVVGFSAVFIFLTFLVGPITVFCDMQKDTIVTPNPVCRCGFNTSEDKADVGFSVLLASVACPWYAALVYGAMARDQGRGFDGWTFLKKFVVGLMVAVVVEAVVGAILFALV